MLKYNRLCMFFIVYFIYYTFILYFIDDILKKYQFYGCDISLL